MLSGFRCMCLITARAQLKMVSLNYILRKGSLWSIAVLEPVVQYAPWDAMHLYWNTLRFPENTGLQPGETLLQLVKA